MVKLLKRAIKEFGKTNRLKAIEFSKKLKNVIDRYNSRNTISDVEDIIEDVVDNLSEELEKIFSDLKKEKQSFPSRSSYALGPKDKDAAKITNRRIRRHSLDEDMSSSYSNCKKHYGPLIDEIW